MLMVHWVIFDLFQWFYIFLFSRKDQKGRKYYIMSTLNNSTNIFWQEYPVGKAERQKLLNQKGCVVWITGLSGSGSFFQLTYILLLFVMEPCLK